MPNEVTVTREELYELVWSKPVVVLAREFGISNVGLAKICKRVEVPRPGLGYWAKVAHGKHPRRLALPPLKSGRDVKISIRRTEKPAASEQAPSSTPVVLVSERLARPHPAVAALKSELDDSSPDHEGLLVVKGKQGRLLKLSRKTGSRALRILDALVRAVAERGYEVRYQKPQDVWGAHRLTVFLGEEEIDLSIIERLDQVPHQLTPSEKAYEKRHGPSSLLPAFDKNPSGRLTLRLSAGWGKEKAWTDGVRKQLESVLGDAVVAIESLFVSLRQKRIENAEWHKAYEAKKQAQAEEAARAAQRQALERDLRDMAARWNEADRVRAFLNAVAEKAPDELRGPAFQAWFDWATSYAKMLDPLSTGVESVAKRLE